VPAIASPEAPVVDVANHDNVIDVRGLTKSYGKTEVLLGVDLQVERGTLVALLGPNGAGKTTIVRILSTLLRFNSGTVRVAGHDVTADANEVRRVIGLTGQSAAVDELLTGRENLAMVGQLYRLTRDSARARAVDLLEQFDLVEAADRPVRTYSGGMRRRLDLAVSLIATPPVIFLDEPTTGLDPRSRLVMWDIIRRLLADGTTILLTTQYLEEADQLADRIVVIDGGRVIAEGTPSALKRRVGNDHLELTFADAAALALAVGALGDDVIHSDEEEITATVGINDTNADVKRALDKLARAGVAVQSLAVHKPTLDDVFLSLTGKERPAAVEVAG
jgi:ABC-2 type transport system ATP-binding protein